MPEPSIIALSKWNTFKANMDGKPTLVNIVINEIHISHVLIDNGCQCYAAISENISNDLNLPIIPISRREV